MDTNEQKALAVVLESALNPLLKSLDKHRQTVSALTVVSLAKEIYSDDERRALLKEYRDLIEQEIHSYEALKGAHDALPDGLSYERRVEKYGEETAREHLAPVLAAMESRKQHSSNLSRFQKEHPLIARLHEFAYQALDQ